jgi:hypothetical protein
MRTRRRSVRHADGLIAGRGARVVHTFGEQQAVAGDESEVDEYVCFRCSSSVCPPYEQDLVEATGRACTLEAEHAGAVSAHRDERGQLGKPEQDHPKPE